jgi:outer membrane protein with beta-barrel domain
MRGIAFAAAALVASMPARPSAQTDSTGADAGRDIYFELHLGAFVPQGGDLHAFGRGYDFRVALGKRLTPNLAVEGEIGYLQSTAHESEHVGFEQAGTQLISNDVFLDQTLEIVPLTASVRYRVQIWAAELSALAGGGLYRATLQRSFEFTSVHPFARDASDTSTILGVHLGIAAAFHLGPKMLLGMEARRTFAEGSFDSGNIVFAGRPLPTRVRLDGVRVAATLGYQF